MVRYSRCIGAHHINSAVVKTYKIINKAEVRSWVMRWWFSPFSSGSGAWSGRLPGADARRRTRGALRVRGGGVGRPGKDEMIRYECNWTWPNAANIYSILYSIFFGQYGFVRVKVSNFKPRKRLRKSCARMGFKEPFNETSHSWWRQRSSWITSYYARLWDTSWRTSSGFTTTSTSTASTSPCTLPGMRKSMEDSRTRLCRKISI